LAAMTPAPADQARNIRSAAAQKPDSIPAKG
jgi:hypothetical protein